MNENFNFYERKLRRCDSEEILIRNFRTIERMWIDEKIEIEDELDVGGDHNFYEFEKFWDGGCLSNEGGECCYWIFIFLHSLEQGEKPLWCRCFGSGTTIGWTEDGYARKIRKCMNGRIVGTIVLTKIFCIANRLAICLVELSNRSLHLKLDNLLLIISGIGKWTRTRECIFFVVNPLGISGG